MIQIVYYLDPKNMGRSFKIIGHRIPEKGEVVRIDVDHSHTTFEVLSHATYYSKHGEECHILVRKAPNEDYKNFERHWDALCRDRK